MNQINKILTSVAILVLSLIYVLIPSISMDSMMHGTQSGKTFIFLFTVIILCIVLFIKSLLFSRTRYFQINILDLFLLMWVLFVIMKDYLQNIPFSLHSFEFYGLIILYISLRLTPRKYLIWFYIALISGSVIQAVYGSLQLWGYYPSHHELFKMTGSFFNPGPYAGYLAAVFPVSFGLFLYNPKIGGFESDIFLSRFTGKIKALVRMTPLISRFFFKNEFSLIDSEKQVQRRKHADYFSIKSFALISIFGMLLVLPASNSRAAWLAILISSFYLFSVKFRLYHKSQSLFNTGTKKILLVFSIFILIVISGAGLYHLKKASTEGRLLIWKVSMNMIRDKPVLGYGSDQFKAHYMNYQANYFEQNQTSEEAMFAGDTNYAFNDFLQYGVEYGILGLIIIAAILFLIFKPSDYKIVEEVPKFHAQDFSGIVAKTGLISILVFGLFSYPSQILPIKTSLILYLSTVASLFSQKKVTFHIRSNGTSSKFFSFILGVIFTLIILFVIFVGSKSLYCYSKAYRVWNKAYRAYQMGAYEICLKDYEKAWAVLKNNGDFLTGYGKALSIAGEHGKAVVVLLKAQEYYPNVVVYTAMGDSYKQLGNAKMAEQAYLNACYMNPSRFYPKYLLAKLYDETGQIEKAILTAKALLQMQIKVPSKAIDEIKEEMKDLIQYKIKN